MMRERVLNGVFAFGSTALAITIVWTLFTGWDGLPYAVRVLGLIGAILVVIESAVHLIRRRRDPDREFR